MKKTQQSRWFPVFLVLLTLNVNSKLATSTSFSSAICRGLRTFGFVDCFRKHHDEGDRYSWWDYRGGAFWKNLGLRIDHVWATSPLAKRCVECDIDLSPRKWKRPSDHAPVWARFEL